MHHQEMSGLNPIPVSLVLRTFLVFVLIAGMAGCGGGSSSIKEPPPTAVPTVTISVNPTIIIAGQSATLTWSSTNATSCTASGAWSGAEGTSGTKTVTPSAAATDTYTLTCSGAGGSGSGSAGLTVNAALAITALSTTSPTALTPLQISTAGLDTTAPITITFSNNSGYSVSEQPIRVASDGTVIAPVPLYVDQNAVQTSSGTVSVTLTQGGLSSAPMTVNIQDLPPVASYGTPLGEISHTFFVYQAMRIARRLGELQAFQAFPGNSVDTTKEQATLHSLLNSVIAARNDIDRVSLDSSLVLSAGILPSGTPIQFDQTSLDLMDRVLGQYISVQMAPILSSASARSKKGLSSRMRTADRRFRSSRSWSYRHGMQSNGFGLGGLHVSFSGRGATAYPGSCSGSSTMCSLLNTMSTVKNLTDITQGFSDFFKPGQDPNAFLDPLLAAGGGLAGLYGLADNLGFKNAAGPFLGAIVSGIGLLQNFGMEIGDLAFIMVASRNGTDPAVIQEAWNDIQVQGQKAYINTIQTELSLVEIGEYAESVVAQGALQAAGLITSVYACANPADGSTPCYQDLMNKALSLSDEANTVFDSYIQGFSEVSGTVDVSNTQDPTLVAESGIEIGPFDQSENISSLADPSGDYDIFIPLQAPNTDYSSQTLTIFDPETGNLLGSAPVDLSMLTTNNPEQLPTIQGTCSDDDASSPDGDDPDCD